MGEWQTLLVPDTVLTTADLVLVEELRTSSGRVDIDELRDGVRFKSTSWVGVLSFTHFTVRIIPKLAGAHTGLVQMLAYTTGLNALQRKRAARQLHTEQDPNLFDLIALLFSEACHTVIRRGLLQDYVEVEADLPVLRGRLRVSDQIRKRFGRIDRLDCRFDDHLTDIRENQLLSAALTVCRLRVSDPTIRNRILRQHTLFEAACSPAHHPIEALTQPFHYHRLNSHYADAHHLARLILSASGINDLLAIGKTRTFAFLLNMNQLFEAFVGKLLAQLVGDRYKVQTQARLSSIIWNKTENRSYASVRPDVVLTDPDGQRLAIDAKYKRYDNKKLSTADIYQTFLYAYAFQGQTPKAWVIYPSDSAQLSVVDLGIRTVDKLVGAQIQAIGLPIPQMLDELLDSAEPSLCSQLAALFVSGQQGLVDTGK